MKPVVFKHGTMCQPYAVIYRTELGDAPAIVMHIDERDPLRPARLLVFDRAEQVEGPPVSALVTNQAPPAELLVFGRAVGGVFQVQAGRVNQLPVWGTWTDFDYVDNRQAPPPAPMAPAATAAPNEGG